MCSLCSVCLGSREGKGSRFTPVCTGWFLQPHPAFKASGLHWGCLYLGPSCTQARCGKYFLFMGQPGVAGISPILALLTSPRSRSKGNLHQLSWPWASRPRHLLCSIWALLPSLYYPRGLSSRMKTTKMKKIINIVKGLASYLKGLVQRICLLGVLGSVLSLQNPLSTSRSEHHNRSIS